MIGEKIDQEKLNLEVAAEIVELLQFKVDAPKMVAVIAGESGSGKTHMAKALEAALSVRKLSSVIIHMDDFFHLPPASNHAARLKDIHHVGPQEVNLPLLNEVVEKFQLNVSALSLPLVNYYENSIGNQIVSFDGKEVLIIEGTYAFYLDNPSFRIFMSRTYEQTKELRVQRNRGEEANDPFVESVLQIEHQLIVQQSGKADAIIDFDFKLIKND